eukprot:7043775-Prymnesium_polylepis.1
MSAENAENSLPPTSRARAKRSPAHEAGQSDRMLNRRVPAGRRTRARTQEPTGIQGRGCVCIGVVRLTDWTCAFRGRCARLLPSGLPDS